MRRLAWAVLLLALVVGAFWLLRRPSPVERVTRSAAPQAAPAVTGSGQHSWDALTVRPAGAVHFETRAGKPAARESGVLRLSGRVVSAVDGRPVPAAELTFSRPEESASVSSAADGSFAFEPRIAGRWQLAAATATGYAPFAPSWGHSPVELLIETGHPVDDLRVALEPVSSLAGLVVDRSGTPIDGVQVKLLGLGPGPDAVVPASPLRRTDALGRFTLPAIRDSVVETSHPDYLPARVRIDATAYLRRTLRIQLEPRTGAILTIRGVVESASGGPAGGARVVASDALHEGNLPAETRADAAGAFTLSELTPGPWRLTAFAPGAAPSLPVTVNAGDGDVRLRLRSGGSIYGRVHTRSGAPTISLFTIAITECERRSLTFGPQPAFEIENVPPGRCRLRAVAGGLAPSEEQSVDVVDGPTGPVDLELSTGGRLTGRVVDAETGSPLQAARVELDGQVAGDELVARIEAVTSQDGTFELGGLPRRTVGVVVSAEGHHARVLPGFTIGDGETQGPLVVALRPVKPGEEPGIEVTGIGAALEKTGDVFRVVQVLAGGGASEAGIAVGDDISAVDGAPVSAMSLGDVVGLIRGPEGTTVMLTVRKGSSGATVALPVSRRIVRT